MGVSKTILTWKLLSLPDYFLSFSFQRFIGTTVLGSAWPLGVDMADSGSVDDEKLGLLVCFVLPPSLVRDR